MLTLSIRWVWLGVVIGSLVGCGQDAETVDPGSEVAESIEGIDPAVLDALPPGVTREMVEEGRQLYVVCSVCHGLDGRGTQLGPSLRGPDWIHVSGEVEELMAIVRTGVPDPVEYPIPMPVMGGGDFDDGELRALASYVDALARSP